jgi:hypothetical protein
MIRYSTGVRVYQLWCGRDGRPIKTEHDTAEHVHCSVEIPLNTCGSVQLILQTSDVQTVVGGRCHGIPGPLPLVRREETHTLLILLGVQRVGSHAAKVLFLGRGSALSIGERQRGSESCCQKPRKLERSCRRKSVDNFRRHHVEVLECEVNYGRIVV